MSLAFIKTLRKHGFELSAELYIAESCDAPAHDGWFGIRVMDTRFGGTEMPIKFVFPMYQVHEPGGGIHEKADAEFVLSDEAVRYLEVADRTRHAYAIPEGIRAEISVDFPDYRYGGVAIKIFNKINDLCQKHFGQMPGLVKLIYAADMLGIQVITRTYEFCIDDPPQRLKLESWAKSVKKLHSGTRVPQMERIEKMLADQSGSDEVGSTPQT